MGLIYTITIFFSAALLFLVQPMVGKMILPMLGGTPAVWNTCMLFFQAALLAGYAYAHGTVSLLGARKQAILHVFILALPFIVLPIAIGRGADPPPIDEPAFWLLGRLLLFVGLPFFVVSTNAPLIQSWFSKTTHPHAHDPYFLYAASNVGSFASLLAYPLLVEPSLMLTEQSTVWSIGYGVLVVLILVCALILWRSPATDAGERADQTEALSGVDPAPLTARRRLWWVFLAFIPSSLLLGVTTHITTDLAPMPLLWVVPLALYLLTFVFVFARKEWIRRDTIRFVMPILVVPTAVLAVREHLLPPWFVVPLHLVAFFAAALACHGVLARSRPHARHLTEFYLWMSVGGVLGGLFNTIIAPMFFNTIAEYPLVLVLSCVGLIDTKRVKERPYERWLDVGLPLLLGVATIAASALAEGMNLSQQYTLGMTIFLPVIVCILFRRRYLRLGLGIAAIVIANTIAFRMHYGQIQYTSRNFFGVKRVLDRKNAPIRILLHGATNHGIQFLDQERRHVPASYFHRTGPLGEVFSTLERRPSFRHVGIIGQGAGAIAAYGRPGQQFDFFEIDPEVDRIARDYFTFLADCKAEVDVVIGDGRLTLEREPNAYYDLLIADAFSSDAVPVHLLTREAIGLYVSKLAPGGVLAMNVSNRYVDLRPLLGNQAADAGLVCLYKADEDPASVAPHPGKEPSRWVVIGRSDIDLAAISALTGWEKVGQTPGVPIWTDQFSNLLGVIRIR